jgi:molybdenum cofactor guanylyltransferase
MSHSLAVLILAGGRSSRMGRDKASLEIDGIPLIRRIYDVVAACRDLAAQRLGDSAQIYVVTPWPQRYKSILPATCHFLPDLTPDCGPIVAFSDCLPKIEATWVLLLACDLPNLSTETVQTWIDRLPLIPAESVAYLAKHPHKGWEPLCGFYRQICDHSLRAYIDERGRSFQGWLQLQSVTELCIADPNCLTNCNTPNDLALVIAAKSRSSAPLSSPEHR